MELPHAPAVLYYHAVRSIRVVQSFRANRCSAKGAIARFSYLVPQELLPNGGSGAGGVVGAAGVRRPQLLDQRQDAVADALVQ